jgi:elongation factor 1 alpha-like protein
MGRLLYDLGEMSEKDKVKNERGSQRVGKSSFAFAWGLDALGDERDRGVTIDIATTHFETPSRNVTLLDAPGHRDFIPAMISGAAQADVALMVVDGSPGEFEAGFQRGGQTREHAWLVRSLGVKEIVVAVNKMDMVYWSQDRYDGIVDALRPFLAAAGFSAAKTTFLPLAAMEGINVAETNLPIAADWYEGPTLVAALDRVEVPERPYASPLRVPLSNVFKGQTAIASGVAVQGRLASGIVQVGDSVRAMPGDVMATVRSKCTAVLTSTNNNSNRGRRRHGAVRRCWPERHTLPLGLRRQPARDRLGAVPAPPPRAARNKVHSADPRVRRQHADHRRHAG